MPIPRLRASNTALLVIDLQDRLRGTIHHAEGSIKASRLLMQAARVLGVPTCLTEHYVKGLGSTVPELAPGLAHCARFEKTKFSAMTPHVEEWLQLQRRGQVIVCGWEAHVCVLQSVLDLSAAGYLPFHATDGISAADASQIPPAFRRMEMAGSTPTGSMAAIYELLGDAEHPKFRECLALVKSNQ